MCKFSLQYLHSGLLSLKLGDFTGLCNNCDDFVGVFTGEDRALSWDGVFTGEDRALSWDGVFTGEDRALSWDGVFTGEDRALSWDGTFMGDLTCEMLFDEILIGDSGNLCTSFFGDKTVKQTIKHWNCVCKGFQELWL